MTTHYVLLQKKLQRFRNSTVAEHVGMLYVEANLSNEHVEAGLSKVKLSNEHVKADMSKVNLSIAGWIISHLQVTFVGQ